MTTYTFDDLPYILNERVLQQEFKLKNKGFLVIYYYDQDDLINSIHRNYTPRVLLKQRYYVEKRFISASYTINLPFEDDQFTNGLRLFTLQPQSTIVMIITRWCRDCRDVFPIHTVDPGKCQVIFKLISLCLFSNTVVIKSIVNVISTQYNYNLDVLRIRVFIGYL